MTMARKNNGGGHRDDQSNDAQEQPYRVGRGHPPKETRWKPGQSGNPTGRRKKRPSFSEVTEQVLNETVEMRMGDRLLRMSNRQALVRSAIRQALAGKPRLLTVLPAIMRYERESLQGQADADLTLTAKDEAILADFFLRQRATDNSGSGEENGIA
jgi:hypothetical protein